MKLKMAFLAILATMAVLASCVKDDVPMPQELLSPQEVYEKCQEYGVDISLREVEDAMASTNRSTDCYDAADLLDLLGQFASCAEDRLIGGNNYFQDANCSVARWQLTHRVRQEDGTFINTGEEPDSTLWVLDGIDSTWAYVDAGELKFQTYITGGIPSDCSPGDFAPQCNGAHSFVVQCWFNGQSYERSGIGYALVNNTPTDNCTEYGPFDVTNFGFFDFSCSCPIEFQPYSMLVTGLEWDLDGDGCVKVGDLLVLLGAYGGC